MSDRFAITGAFDLDGDLAPPLCWASPHRGKKHYKRNAYNAKRVSSLLEKLKKPNDVRYTRTNVYIGM
jgi:hypothetical protein